MSNDLSRRKKQIIVMLIDSLDYLSANSISENLNVSRRTILRELDGVEKWFNENQVPLSRKTSKGLKLDLDEVQRNKLLLKINGENIDFVLTPLERRKRLLIELLNSNDSKKLYYFSSLLKVSEATISYDLDKIEKWLEDWKLKLIRKPGYGIEIQGEEKNFRKAIIDLINQNFDRAELLRLVKEKYIEKSSDKHISMKNTLLNVIGFEIIDAIETAVENSGAMVIHPLADSSYAALIVHLSLAITRIKAGDKIIYDHIIIEEIRESNEYILASKIIDEARKIIGIDIPDNEISYVALHLKGSRLRRTNNNNFEIKVNDYEIIYLVELLIKEMELISGLLLQENKLLVTGLVNHFGPALSRIKQGFDIKNPLLNEMKTRYKRYFMMVEKAIDVVENHVKFKIPEDELGYLTMHFTAAIESVEKLVKLPWNIAITCSTGIGSSRLLEARIKKNYENMVVKAICSTLNMKEILETENIDLIISTVPIMDSKVPSVVVSPLLLDEDMRRIESLLNTLIPMRKSDVDITTERESLLSTLDSMGKLSKSSREILNNFFLIQVPDYKESEFSLVASKYIGNESNYNKIHNELLNRETKGTTSFDDGRGTLLHCMSAELNEVHFGFVVSNSGNYAGVMIGPMDLDFITRSLLGKISQNLNENHAWIKHVKNNNVVECYEVLEEIIKGHIVESLLTKGGLTWK